MGTGPRFTVDRARDQLAGHADDGLSWPEFGLAIQQVVRRAVPFDAAVMATTDPVSGMMSTTVRTGVDESADEAFVQVELTHRDNITLTTLATTKSGVGILSDGPDAHDSPRIHEFLRPHFGFEHEMRGVARVGGRMIGACGIYRARHSRDFTAEEADTLAGLQDVIALGVRRALSADAVQQAQLEVGPAVLIADTDGRILEATRAANTRLDLIGVPHVVDGLPRLPGAIRMVAEAARLQASGTPTSPYTHVRSLDGRWFVVSAAWLSAGGGAGRAAITIEPTDTSQALELDFDAYGITDRERAVIRAVATGATTTSIATALGISAYTVQDHLKAIFRKVGVSSRSELIAKLTRLSAP